MVERVNMGAGEGVIFVGGVGIPVGEVEVIAGEKGLSLSGGEMLVWKRTVVVAGGRRYVSRRPSGEQEKDLAAWMAACPRAVGIRADGSVELPRVEAVAGEDPLVVLNGSLKAVGREFGRQVVIGLVWAVGLVVAGAGVIGFVVMINVGRAGDPVGIRLGFLGLALFVGAFLVGGRAVGLFMRRGRVLGVVRGVATEGKLEATALAAALGPNVGASKQVAAVPGVLAVLSICLVICPFVGFVVGVVAFGLNYRERSWARTLALVAMVISGLLSVLGVVGILLGW